MRRQGGVGQHSRLLVPRRDPLYRGSSCDALLKRCVGQGGGVRVREVARPSVILSGKLRPYGTLGAPVWRFVKGHPYALSVHLSVYLSVTQRLTTVMLQVRPCALTLLRGMVAVLPTGWTGCQHTHSRIRSVWPIENVTVLVRTCILREIVRARE